MKRTRINSILFIIIGCLPLAAATFFMVATGIVLKSYIALVGWVIGAVVVAIVGFRLLLHCHQLLFGEVMTYCDDCSKAFKESEIKKQVEHTFGKMYVSYRCPHCSATILG